MILFCFLQDLGNKDLLREAYLIAHIYKIGKTLLTILDERILH